MEATPPSPGIPAGPLEDRLIGPGYTSATVTDKISSVVLAKTPRWWYLAFGVSFLLVMMLFYSIAYLVTKGVGVFGVNVPVGWGWDITNFVWWIGIGHAGTLISAILLLLRQEWRNSINRFAAAMTIFAVACAGLYPILHLGRPWVFYWLFPYPNSMGIWKEPVEDPWRSEEHTSELQSLTNLVCRLLLEKKKKKK